MADHKPTPAPRKPRTCAYCGDPAKSVITPEDGSRFYVCEGHEERGIVESGSGFIKPLKDITREG